MNKKVIIIAAAAGLISLGAGFGVAWFTKPAVPIAIVDEYGVAKDGQMDSAARRLAETEMLNALPEIDSDIKKTMTRKQLQSLIYEIREKANEYETRLKEFELREERLQMANKLLQKDIEQLDSLRTELSSTVASLRQQRDKLKKSRVEIDESEKKNLLTIAATYNKMPPESSSEILSNMAKMEQLDGTSGFEDAVKILYHMSERTRAKLLASLVDSKPDLAAIFSRKLRQISDKE